MKIPLDLTKIPLLHCTHKLQLFLKHSKNACCSSVKQAIPDVYNFVSISKCLSPIASSKY